MSLDALIATVLKVKTRPVENRLTASVGTSAVEILGNDPNRLAFTVINLSANILYICPGRDPSSSKGIVLAPNGGSASATWSEDFHTVGVSWFALASGAASAVYTLEEVEYA